MSTATRSIGTPVDRIEGRSVCGMRVGDALTVTESCRIRIPEDGHFCLYALSAALPLIPAKQRALPVALPRATTGSAAAALF